MADGPDSHVFLSETLGTTSQSTWKNMGLSTQPCGTPWHFLCA